MVELYGDPACYAKLSEKLFWKIGATRGTDEHLDMLGCLVVLKTEAWSDRPAGRR